MPLKFLIIHWGTLEMSQINCGINLMLTILWSINCARTFLIPDRKLFVAVVTLKTTRTIKIRI